MKVRIYGFHDRGADAFVGDAAALVLFRNDVVALRQFKDLCVQEHSMFARHPSDYELVSLGEFDTESGDITPWVGGPAVVATAAQVMDKEAKE